MFTAPITLPPIITTFSRPITPGLPTDPMETTPPSPTWIPERPHSAGLWRRPSFSSESSGPSSPWRIEPGSFITFSLDSETLAHQLEDHPVAYQSVREFRGGRYLGLVMASFVHRVDDGRPVEELIVNFVANTLPPIAEVAHHHLLVEPNESDDPRARGPALQTMTMLPWPDLVQWTSFGTRLVVDTGKLHESSLRFALQDEDMNRLENQATLDHEDFGSIMPLERVEDDDLLRKLLVPDEIHPAEVWRDIRVTDADRRENPATWIAETEYIDRYIQEWQARITREEVDEEDALFQEEMREREKAGQEVRLEEQDTLQNQELQISEEAQVQRELLNFDMEE
ncbi:hypothetical protein B0H21DRAFT_706729 [Amylocystis lapponica]|nr:hypothetical protein B0H21DRAFT_706729 [Amylocystis lapponica]